MRRITFERPALIGLLGIGAASAIAGAVGLVGGGMGLPLDMLDGTPFTSYTAPGLILGGIVGGSQLLAAAAVVRRTPGNPTAAALAGVIMMGWIAGQVLLIGSQPGIMRNLQIGCAALGAVQTALAARQVQIETLAG